MRGVISVLGIGLMLAGFLVDNSARRRQRQAGGTTGKEVSTRLPMVLFSVGAVLLVLANI
jgi:hypothetical protein